MVSLHVDVRPQLSLKRIGEWDAAARDCADPLERPGIQRQGE